MLRAASTVVRSRSLAGQALDDGGSGVASDGVHVAHGLGLLGRDRGLRLGETLVEVGLERLALGVALGGQLGAGLLSQGLGAALGLGERLLVGGAGVFRAGFHGSRVVEIAGDRRAAVFDDSAQAREDQP